jgi:signal transduction histidine kinase
LLLAVLATGLIAVLFEPLRQRLQRAVNRFMYGQRDEPLALLAQLGEQLEQAAEPETILPTAVQTIAQSLKLPFVAVTLGAGEEQNIVASSDKLMVTNAKVSKDHSITSSPHHLISLPLIYQTQPIGQLLLAQRDNGAFSPRELTLLHEIARQTAVAAHTVHLHQELRQARLQLVTAQAEERRRVSRALHDGLGAQLAALLIQADKTRQELMQGADTAVTDIQTLKNGTQTAVQSVRTLVGSLDEGNRYSVNGKQRD